MQILVIIDPQIDFVSGALAVPGAPEAMRWLASWMRQHAEQLAAVYVSMDQHPRGHCSFVSEGGPWPPHCVRYTAGAALEPAIAEALEELRRQGVQLHFIEKATLPERDSYSAFADAIPTELLRADRVYLAGLAGDYCVRESAQDLLRALPEERLCRLEEGIAWITPPER